MLPITTSLRMGKGLALAAMLGFCLTGCENRGSATPTEAAPPSVTGGAEAGTAAGKSGGGGGQAVPTEDPFADLYFKGSFEEALAQARKQARMLVVFIGLDGCLNCELFTQEVLRTEKAKAWVSAHVVLYKTHTIEDNQRLTGLYATEPRPFPFPSMLFLRGNGDLLGKVESNFNTHQLSGEAFYQAAEEALERFKTG